MLISEKLPNLRSALIICLAVIVINVLFFVPFSWPMGGFWLDAQQFARSGHIGTTFTPCGYPALLGLGVRIGGVTGAIAIQLTVYATTLAAVYYILRALTLAGTPALLGASFICIYPELVLSIKKVWDTDITTAFLMLICAILLTILKRGLTLGRAMLTGIVWGLSINVRPNFPTLVLPIAFAFLFAPAKGRPIREVVSAAMVTATTAVLAVISVGTLVHGSFYIPENGPYNLYAGANAFTERALLANLNAEPSIYPSLLADGFGRDVNVYSSALRPYYVQHAILYCRRYPSEAIKLFFLKLLTLLRPDVKIYPLGSLGGVVKALEALAVPCWLVTLLVLRDHPWGNDDWLFVMFVLAYTIPFVLTNSDPRFRVPLDILVLTHTFYRLARFSRVSSWGLADENLSQDRLVRAAN
jgi:hypothetical protein